jgi:hypothetical protein
MLEPKYERPNYQAAAAFIDHDRSNDVVIDETGEISPGPLTPLDVTLRKSLIVVRAGSPAERDHPFGFADAIVPLSQAIRSAVAAAHGGRIVVVSTVSPPGDIAGLTQRTAPLSARFPDDYRLVEDHAYPGIARAEVRIYSAHARRSG